MTIWPKYADTDPMQIRIRNTLADTWYWIQLIQMGRRGQKCAVSLPLIMHTGSNPLPHVCQILPPPTPPTRQNIIFYILFSYIFRRFTRFHTVGPHTHMRPVCCWEFCRLWVGRGGGGSWVRRIILHAVKGVSSYSLPALYRHLSSQTGGKGGIYNIVDSNLESPLAGNPY